MQCGYCINGMIMQAAAFLKRVPKPTATGNAMFDAIGVRLRSVPLTPGKVLAAIKKS